MDALSSTHDDRSIGDLVGVENGRLPASAGHVAEPTTHAPEDELRRAFGEADVHSAIGRAHLAAALPRSAAEPAAASTADFATLAALAGARARPGLDGIPRPTDAERCRAESLVRAAEQRASALLSEARRTSAQRLGEASERAALIHLAAERGLESAQLLNALYLRAVERHAQEIVAFARAVGASIVGEAADVGGGAAGAANPSDDRADAAAPGRSHVPQGSSHLRDLRASRATEAGAAELPSIATSDPRAPPAAGLAITPARDAVMDLGHLEFVVGPFHRFSQLAIFMRALRGIAGVRSADTRQFVKGMVSLRVQYEDPLPFATRILDLHEFKPRILSEAPGRIELRVEPVPPEIQDSGA